VVALVEKSNGVERKGAAGWVSSRTQGGGSVGWGGRWEMEGGVGSKEMGNGKRGSLWARPKGSRLRAQNITGNCKIWTSRREADKT